MKLESGFVSSLAKVFPDEELSAPPIREAGAFPGEVYSLQFVYRADLRLDELTVEIDSPLAAAVTVRRVGVVPVEFVASQFDDDVLRRTPGMYPDLLTGLAGFRAAPFQWHSLWLTVRLPEECPAGDYPIRLKLINHCPWSEEQCGSCESPEFHLHVLPGALAPSPLTVTEWFHADCLFTRYGVAPWSEGHWSLIERYFRNMTAHGITMIYVPLFTPPLDTEVGGMRPTTQLLGIRKESDGSYRFDFSRLQRYLETADRAGFRNFELPHFFTQWGAAHAPKIIAEIPGVGEKQLFGWETASANRPYRDFLEALLPELRRFLEERQLQSRIYLHVSDEPYDGHLADYRAAAELLHRHFAGYKFIDALSNPVYFQQKLVQIPVPPSNHIEKFRDLELPERWVYYCVSQWDQVSNQFMHFPSARNRIMGLLCYVYAIDGFLHWGYNFWFAQFSKQVIDPYRTTDALWGFPPGDAFRVYPGPDGPEDSIRHEVFFEAIQDHAALKRLERTAGREAVLALIAEHCGGELPTMAHYPRGEAWLLAFRAELNRAIVIREGEKS